MQDLVWGAGVVAVDDGVAARGVHSAIVVLCLYDDVARLGL